MKWINVKDRIPNHDCDCLIKFDTKEETDGTFIKIDNSFNYMFGNFYKARQKEDFTEIRLSHSHIGKKTDDGIGYLLDSKVIEWVIEPPTFDNSGYMVRIAKAILSQIAKVTSYIRKRYVK